MEIPRGYITEDRTPVVQKERFSKRYPMLAAGIGGTILLGNLLLSACTNPDGKTSSAPTPTPVAGTILQIGKKGPYFDHIKCAYTNILLDYKSVALDSNSECPAELQVVGDKGEIVDYYDFFNVK